VAVPRGGAAAWRHCVAELWLVRIARAPTVLGHISRDSATTTPLNIPFSSVFSWHSSVTLLRFRGLRNSSTILAMVKNFRLTLKLTLTTLCAFTKNGFPWKFSEMFAALYIRSTGCSVGLHTVQLLSVKSREVLFVLFIVNLRYKKPYRKTITIYVSQKQTLTVFIQLHCAHYGDEDNHLHSPSWNSCFCL